MKQKISFDIKTIIAIIACIIAIRGFLYYMPDTKPYVGKYAYNFVTRNFSENSIEQLENAMLDTEEISFYYLGRGSCGDCREAVQNIKTLNSLAEDKYKIQMNYVKLADSISEDERNFLNDVGVEEIPIMLLVNNGNVKQFDIYDITAGDFEDKFGMFMQEKESTNEEN